MVYGFLPFDAVFTDAAVFGDTNLELLSIVSNWSVVEVHVNVGSNILSRDGNGLKLNNELPLHVLYQLFSLSWQRLISQIFRHLH